MFSQLQKSCELNVNELMLVLLSVLVIMQVILQQQSKAHS